MESEETQDYVREAKDLNQEEAEEMSFAPSAISVPQKPLFRCDNRCSGKKTLSFWQFASVVMKEGEKSYTTNLCQQCYNKFLVARGDKPLTKWQWYEFVEKEAHRGRLWRMLGKDQYIREMWEYYCSERSRVKKVREDAEKGRQAGIQGPWQHESPARESLEQVRCCNDTDCTPRMMKQAFLALKGGDWEEYKSIFRTEVKATERARIKETFEKVAKDEARMLSTVQEIMIRSTDYLRRIIAPAGRQGGVTMSCARIATVFLWKTTFGGSQIPQRVEKAHKLVVCDLWRAVPQGLCGNLINALKLLANQHEDGDGLMQNIVTNLCEESRKGLTNGLREFIQIDNHRAFEVGHQREGLGTFKIRRGACQGKPRRINAEGR